MENVTEQKIETAADLIKEAFGQKEATPANESADTEKIALENIKKAEAAEKPKEESKEDDVKELEKPTLENELPDAAPKAKEKKEAAKEPTKTEKLWWEDEPKTEDKDGGKDKDVKDNKSDEYVQKAREYEELIKDPEVEAFLAAKKAGKTALEFIESVKPVDYDKMSPEKLQEIKLKSLGLTDDEMAEALDEFNSLPKWKKLEEVATLKDSLKKEQSERLKMFTTASAQQMERQETLRRKAELDLNKHLDTLVGNEFYGMKITESEHKIIKDTVMNESAAFNRDGTLDVERSIRYAVVDKLFKQFMQANMNKARASAMEEAFKEVSRPTAKAVEVSRQPMLSEEEELRSAIKSTLSKQVR